MGCDSLALVYSLIARFRGSSIKYAEAQWEVDGAQRWSTAALSVVRARGVSEKGKVIRSTYSMDYFLLAYLV